MSSRIVDVNMIRKKRNIANIKLELTKTIGKCCEESDWTITFEEVNKALVELLDRNNLEQLRDD